MSFKIFIISSCVYEIKLLRSMIRSYLAYYSDLIDEYIDIKSI